MGKLSRKLKRQPLPIIFVSRPKTKGAVSIPYCKYSRRVTMLIDDSIEHSYKCKCSICNNKKGK